MHWTQIRPVNVTYLNLFLLVLKLKKYTDRERKMKFIIGALVNYEILKEDRRKDEANR